MRTHGAIDFHNAIAVEFNGKYETSKAFQERFDVWTRLFERYINPTDHVIDLGCGSGVFSNYLANKGCIVTGIDGSVAMITLCNQQKRVANVRYAVESLPVMNPVVYAPQDVVLMSSFLEYVDDITAMLEQARTMLRLNGLLIVSIPNRQSIYRTVERLLFRLTKRPAYFAHSQHSSTATAFRQQLNRLGFDTLETGYLSDRDPISRVLKPFLAKRYVNNLLIGICRKRAF